MSVCGARDERERGVAGVQMATWATWSATMEQPRQACSATEHPGLEKAR
jgi:hypothetical protein